MLLILAFSLLVFEHQHSAIFLSVKRFATTVMMPLQYVAELPVRVGKSVIDHLQVWRDLRQENTALRMEQALLQAQLLRLAFLEKQQESLQALVTAHPSTKAKSFVVASVISVSSSSYSDQIWINQGTRQGVFVGEIVLDDKGLVGQVMDVTPLTSRVLLITDPSSGVPAQVLESGVRGMLVGRGLQGRLSMDYVPVTANVKVGDLLVSSGLGGRFPVGYPIAKVTQVRTQASDIFLQIDAVPVANIAGDNFVLLLSSAK